MGRAGLVVTGASCNRDNNSHSVWTKKPGDYLQKKLSERPYVTEKGSNFIDF